MSVLRYQFVCPLPSIPGKFISGITPGGDFWIPGEGTIKPRRSKRRIPIDIPEPMARTLELDNQF